MEESNDNSEETTRPKPTGRPKGSLNKKKRRKVKRAVKPQEVSVKIATEPAPLPLRRYESGDMKESISIKKVDKQPESLSTKLQRKRPVSNIRRGQRIYADKREGFERRYVSDVPGRIGIYQRNGWEIVVNQDYLGERRDGEPKNENGDMARIPSGGGGNLVLMEIPSEWYNETKQEEQDQIDLIEQNYKGQLGSEIGDGKSYGKIKIGNKT